MKGEPLTYDKQQHFGTALRYCAFGQANEGGISQRQQQHYSGDRAAEYFAEE